MQTSLRRFSGLLTVLILVGLVAGLSATAKRYRVEARNRRVEIALEWQEVTQLAQSSGQALPGLLGAFHAQGVSTMVVQEDTLTTLEQSGAARPTRVLLPSGRPITQVVVDSPETLRRIQAALTLHNLRATSTPTNPSGITATEFVLPEARGFPPPLSTPGQPSPVTFVSLDYQSLRTLGVGLPNEAMAMAMATGLRVAGRIGNFQGVSPLSAQAVLQSLAKQGVTTIIFSGEEVVGYRGLEKQVADLFRDPNSPPKLPSSDPEAMAPLPSTGLAYGAVEFGKQKGDEKLSAALHGDFVRVHSIQTAELGQMDEVEAVDRFAKAARERNIRFCYVRLLTFAGEDPVADNLKFVDKVARGIAHGGAVTGGELRFGAARRYEETGVPTLLFALMGLGTAAGIVWMIRAAVPLPSSASALLLALLSLLCALVAWRLDETGRKIVALLAGIAFPAVACLRTFPRSALASPLSPTASLFAAIKSLLLASAITGIGIVHVVGLLATRTFMVHASQFLGIKAQHAVPLIVVALVAVAGGVVLPEETWSRWKARAANQFRAAMQEPARFGMLIVGIVALAAVLLIVARTGNDAGVGVSGSELKVRALLDRVLPVRPRTKEFLVGHPLFIIGLAWWWRGRKRLGIPCFVFGSLGQVSLLNTFCHVHTPLIISLWRDGIGLVLGTLVGSGIFLLAERLLPAPRQSSVGAPDLPPPTPPISRKRSEA